MPRCAAISPVVALRLSKTYHTRRGPSVVVDEFSLEIAAGEVVALVGPPGAGKSTILAMMAGLVPPTAGSVHFGGESDSATARPTVLYPSLGLMPWLSARENVALAIRDPLHVARLRELKERVDQALELAEVDPRAATRVRDVSPAEQQRIALARALVEEPTVLLLDNPLAALDPLGRIELQQGFQRLWTRQPMTTLWATDDIDETLLVADRIVVLTASPARIARIVEVPLARPRIRSEVLRGGVYFPLRQQIAGDLATASSRTEHLAVGAA
jgi:ABC-type nitrate/sulfonate/bicarbonate transport system ATPase subunit